MTHDPSSRNLPAVIRQAQPASRVLMACGLAGACALGVMAGLWAKPDAQERRLVPEAARLTDPAPPRQLEIVINDAPGYAPEPQPAIETPEIVGPALLAPSQPMAAELGPADPAETPGAPTVTRVTAAAPVRVIQPRPAVLSIAPEAKPVRVVEKPVPKAKPRAADRPAKAQQADRKAETARARAEKAARSERPERKAKAEKAERVKLAAAAKAKAAQKAVAEDRRSRRVAEAKATSRQLAQAEAKALKAKLRKAEAKQKAAELRLAELRAEKSRAAQKAKKGEAVRQAEAAAQRRRVLAAQMAAARPSEIRKTKATAAPPRARLQKASANRCALSDPGASAVCANPSLGAVDRRMTEAYRQAEAAGAPAERLQRQHRRWLAARSAAAREASWAVEDVYQERIAELREEARNAQSGY